jgi:hypothetical protein
MVVVTSQHRIPIIHAIITINDEQMSNLSVLASAFHFKSSTLTESIGGIPTIAKPAECSGPPN